MHFSSSIVYQITFFWQNWIISTISWEFFQHSRFQTASLSGLRTWALDSDTLCATDAMPISSPSSLIFILKKQVLGQIYIQYVNKCQTDSFTIPLHLLQLWAGLELLCGESDYFWDSVFTWHWQTSFPDRHRHSPCTPQWHLNIRGEISSLRVYSICNYACNLNLANCCVHTYHQKKISYKINITKLLYLTAKNTGLIVNISFPWSHVLRSRPFVGSVGRSPHFGGSGSRKRT